MFCFEYCTYIYFISTCCIKYYHPYIIRYRGIGENTDFKVDNDATCM